jgi:hypothetical protein
MHIRNRLLWIGACLALLSPLTGTPAAAADGPRHRFETTPAAPFVHDPGNPGPAGAASSLCRTAFVNANPYGPTDNTDLIVGDTVLRGSPCVSPQNETPVAVNPRNPLNLVAGANDYRVCCDFQGIQDATGWAYSSSDGGASWTNAQLPGLTAETGGKGIFGKVDSAGDPAIAFGPDGTVYYANIAFSRISAASIVAVNVSHDGGLTWSEPRVVTFSDTPTVFNDKDAIAVAPNGNVFVTWTKFNTTARGVYLSSPIVFSVSRDGGTTWSREMPVSDPSHPFDQGSAPVFDSRGIFYVAYEGATPSSRYAQDATIVARSTDGGATFTNKEIGRVYDDLDCYPLNAVGSQTLSGEQFRLNSFPAASLDPTTGQLLIVWADDQGAGSCGNGGTTFSGTTSNQVKLVTSPDGLTFSAPRRITSGAADKVFPAVAANVGKSAVSYYTRAYSPDTETCAADGLTTGSPVCLDAAARVSTDNFASELRLTDASSNPFVQFRGSFIGDYTGIALGSDGIAHPVWTDFRGNPNLSSDDPLNRANQDAYTQAFAVR